MAADLSPAHVLQVTDCHLFPDSQATLLGVNTQASLAAVLRAACRERRPDALLATGDIAQDASADTYRLFLDTVRAHFDGPLLCVPGNHDHGATFSAALPCDDLEIRNWRIRGVDTHIDDVVGGRVGSDELARLADALDGAGPTLVVGHHCPVAFGTAWLDVHRIEDGEALMRLLARAKVPAYAFGHIHQEADVPLSTRLLGTPSTCFQFATNTAEFAIDDAKPGYRWLHLAEDGSVTSDVRRIADYPMNINLKDRGRR